MIRVGTWVKWMRSLITLFIISIALTIGMLAIPQKAFAHTMSSQPASTAGSQPVQADKQNSVNGQVALNVKAQPLADDLCNALTIIQKPHGFHATIKSYIAIHFLTKFGISIVGPFALDWNSLTDFQVGLKICGMISFEKFFLQLVNNFSFSSSNTFTIGWD